MRVLEIEAAQGSLSEYARKNRRHAVIVTRNGKPISALVPLEPDTDVERLSLSMSRRFRTIIERARAQVREGRVTSSAKVRQQFGLERRAG